MLIRKNEIRIFVRVAPIIRIAVNFFSIFLNNPTYYQQCFQSMYILSNRKSRAVTGVSMFSANFIRCLLSFPPQPSNPFDISPSAARARKQIAIRRLVPARRSRKMDSQNRFLTNVNIRNIRWESPSFTVYSRMLLWMNLPLRRIVRLRILWGYKCKMLMYRDELDEWMYYREKRIHCFECFALKIIVIKLIFIKWIHNLTHWYLRDIFRVYSTIF